MKLTNENVKELRKDFPLLQSRVIYLDNAATTQKPKQVIAAMQKFYEEQNANIHRGVYTLSEQATKAYDGARKTVAGFINASFEEVIFTRGTTESLNLLAYTLQPLLQGKEIVLTEMEHHANMVPWQEFAKRHGMTVKYIAVKDDFTLDYEDAKAKITEDTALVALTHVSNALGTKNDIDQIISLAKQHSALTIIDAAQSVPHTKVDVKALDCDFLAFSGHKMLGPTGIGVLYGKKELLEKMQPFHFGGDMIREVTYEQATWNDLPMKFEAGTPNIAGAVGLAAAVKYLENIGVEHIAAWEQDLLDYALEKLKELDIETYTTNEGGILSFNLKELHPHDVASLLNDDKVCIRGGHHCAMPLMNKLNLAGTARASFYLYNTREDVDILANAIKKAQELGNGR